MTFSIGIESEVARDNLELPDVRLLLDRCEIRASH
jgi:hypothetical protein